MKLKIIAILIGMSFIASTIALAQPMMSPMMGSGVDLKKQQEERTAYFEQQREKNKQFRESLKGKSKEEQAAAMKAYRDSQFGDNKAFEEKMHQGQLESLKSRLANDPNMSEPQRAEAIKRFEDQYQSRITFRDQMRIEQKAFMEKIANMSPEQKQAAMKARSEEQRVKAKEFWAKQREGNRPEQRNMPPVMGQQELPVPPAEPQTE